MLTYPTGSKRVLAVGGVHLSAIDINLGLLRSIDSCHHDIGSEGLTGIEGCFLRNDECIKTVYTDVLDVDVCHKRVEHLTLGIAYIALKLRQQRYGRCHWHTLEHVFLPVLAQCIVLLWDFRREVVGNEFLLVWVSDHLQYPLAIGVDGIVELSALSCSRCKHHLCRSLYVVLADDVGHIGIFSVCLPDNLLLQALCIVEERVTHLLDYGGLLKPRLHLLWIGLHLLKEGTVQGLVLLGRVGSSAVQALLDNGKSVEHLC